MISGYTGGPCPTDTQPVGEYPEISIATTAAFNALDSICKELESLQRANAELNQELSGLRETNKMLCQSIVKIAAERDTARAESYQRQMTP